MNEYKDFDVKTVELAGSNLIEASAGTGKTYSIAILVLRILLEKQIPIQEILMVTFTKAAVAELEERIRLFVREAKRCADGQEIEDKSIEEIVQKSIESNGQEAVARLLKLAVLNLDETSVMTIHGFCQQTLNEFAFETGQLFGAELLQNSSPIVEEEVQQFWRTHVTTIQKDLLAYLTEQNISLAALSGYVQSHLSGKTYLFYNENEVYDFNEEKQKEFNGTIQKLNEEKLQIEKIALQYINDNFSELKELSNKDKNAFKAFNGCSDSNSFLNQLISKIDVSYVKKLYAEIRELAYPIIDLKNSINEITINCLNHLYSFAIQEVTQKVKEHKISRALLSFDDLIGNLHQALVERVNPDLEEKLRKKYQAVFIDEFQDTDRLQYEIFEKAFAGHGLLFYIGDPKQSIYAWRTADIFTYFKARSSVDSVYGMNVNYRSNAQFIEAMNRFFLPKDNFDTFYFETSTEKIDYISVQSPANNRKGILKYKWKPVSGIGINETKNKETAKAQAALQVHALLTDENYKIFDKNFPEGRRVRPSDIGVLVRGKKAGKQIKALLDKKGIPAITVDESKILQSAEAKAVLGVLEAMVSPKRSTINLVLLSGFLNWPKEDVLASDEEILVEKFKTYYEKWVDKGIYSALLAWMDDFNIRQNLLGNYEASGERTLTNLYHLIEVLYKIGNRQNLNPEELIEWLKIKINTNDNQEDEFQQRIENDEEAVRIVTIHSSKGLEYNLVIAPELDFKFREEKERIETFRDENGNYKAATLSEMSESDEKLFKLQFEQENRRLLYVAITRAVMNCFIFSTETKETTMSVFKAAIDYDGEFISQLDGLEENDLIYQIEEEKQSQELVASNFQLKSNYWMRTSYSALAARLESKMRDAFVESADPYDEFVFKELRKGAKTGNFLHYLFENLNFQKEESWEKVLDKALARFHPNADEDFKNHILLFLKQVLQTQLPNENPFAMAEVQPFEMLNELEFDFPLPSFSVQQLERLMGDKIKISDRFPHQIEGMMNGKIDLFFRHQGKYYVLDWKSNYLGPDLEDYSAENLEEAMTDANYHLQYMIYCLAVKKYLSSRLGDQFYWDRDFGGVFYLFVRGMRTGTDFGIYHKKVKWEELAQMERMMRMFEERV